MPSGCQPQTKTNELTLNLPIGCYQLHSHSQMIQQLRLLKQTDRDTLCLSQMKIAEINDSLKIITKAQNEQHVHQSHSSLRP